MDKPEVLLQNFHQPVDEDCERVEALEALVQHRSQQTVQQPEQQGEKQQQTDPTSHEICSIVDATKLFVEINKTYLSYPFILVLFYNSQANKLKVIFVNFSTVLGIYIIRHDTTS